MAVKSLIYDVGIYEKQRKLISKSVREDASDLTPEEYLYGFREDSKLNPVITLILYAGNEEWDGPQNLHDIIDFTDIPEQLKKMVVNYQLNLTDMRRLEDTSVFKTDIKQAFDFIRCSNDKNALKTLTENDDYYKNMQEEAFDVAVSYTNATELISAKEDYLKKGEVDMCQALKDLIQDRREEGREEERINTERERARADAECQRADQAEAELHALREQLEKLQINKKSCTLGNFMNYFDFIEEKQRGTPDFPLSYYYVDETHPNYQMPFRWHRELEIGYIISGSCTFYLNDNIVVANEIV